MYRWVVKAFLAWRVIVFLIAILAIFFVPLRSGYTEVSSPFKGYDLANMWVNFDGLHYIDIARNGYSPTHPAAQAFFPVFPIVVGQVAHALRDYVLSGLLVAHTSLLVALYFLYKLIKLDYSEKIAKNTLVLLLLFPTSFFFTCFYSESFFLLEVVLAFYFARTGKWFWAALWTALATATRITGVFMVPALVIEYFLAYKLNIVSAIKSRNFIWILLSPIGLLLYMYYLWVANSDPLYFAHVMPIYGMHRQMNHIVLLYQVFYRYIKMVIFMKHQDPLFFVVFLELLTGILFTGLSLLSFKIQRLSYAFFLSASFLLPTLLGTFSSVPRYVIVLFPAFMLLGQWFTKQKKPIKVFYITINVLASILAISLFTRGYFIG